MPVETEDRKSEIQQLEELSKRLKGKREYRRLQSVLLHLNHKKNVDEIADLLQIHRRTVYKHLRRYRKEGLATFEARKPGLKEGPHLLSSEEEKSLLKGLEAQADEGQLLTGGQLKKVYEEKELESPWWHSVPYTSSCIATAGVSSNPPAPDIQRETRRRKASSKKLSEKLKSVVKSASKPLKLFFQDESRFGRISQAIGCWAPAGKRPVVPNQIVREYTYSYTAICPVDGENVSLICLIGGPTALISS